MVFGPSLPLLFYKTGANAGRGSEETEGRVPSWVDSRDSSICGYKPGHYPIPENTEKQQPITHESHEFTSVEMLVKFDTEL